VLSLPSRRVLFSRTYQTDNKEGGWGAGIFGNSDELAQFAQRTLNETVDKVLSDPEFIASLKRQSFARYQTNWRVLDPLGSLHRTDGAAL